jgi:Leucine-rich repeat (LRR) protein
MYKNKYFKYKTKYLKLCNQLGGECDPTPAEDALDPILNIKFDSTVKPEHRITLNRKCYNITTLYKRLVSFPSNMDNPNMTYEDGTYITPLDFEILLQQYGLHIGNNYIKSEHRTTLSTIINPATNKNILRELITRARNKALKEANNIIADNNLRVEYQKSNKAIGIITLENENLLSPLHVNATILNYLYPDDTIVTINLRNRKIISIDPNTFLSYKNLLEINFSSNQITNIPVDLFKNLNNLQKIDFSSNQITNIPVGLFDNLNNLQKIDFSHNEITDIPVDLFNNLNNLQEIDFGFNEITNIPAGLFDNLNNLQKIILSHNKINTIIPESISMLKMLKTIILDNNSIVAIDSYTFDNLANLESIYLLNNEITKISQYAFNNLPQLTKIHLENNIIETVEQSAFNNLDKLEFIYFKNNKITTVEPSAFTGSTTNDKVKLSYKPK